jgi:hypothetical protein
MMIAAIAFVLFLILTLLLHWLFSNALWGNRDAM